MKYLALDIETIGLKLYGGKVWMVGTFDGKKYSVIADPYGVKKLPAELIAKLKDRKICKVIHSSQFDVPYLTVNCGGLKRRDTADLLKLLDIEVNNVWDTELCERLILGVRLPKDNRNPKLEEAYSTKLQHVLKRYGLNNKMDKDIRKQFINRPMGVPFTKEEHAYLKSDVVSLIELQKAQEYLLTRDGLLELALLENRCAERIHRMRIIGIGFDSERWRKIAADNKKEFERRMAKLPKVVANWNSPKQVKNYFESIGVIIDSYDNIDEIYMECRNKTLGDFITTRELNKSVTSYGLNFFESGFVDPDNAIRTSVDQIINTGRMAFSEPNLQQLPGDGNSDPLRKMILEMLLNKAKVKPIHRTAFVPRKGNVFCIGDFSGQELGIMAAASQEKSWIQALLRGEDVHSVVASMLFANEWAQSAEKGCKFPKKCECKGHKSLRSPAKILDFMLAYGGGAGKFSKITSTDLFNSKLIVKRYKKIIPNLTDWLERNGREALDTGVSFSASPYKRRRVLRGEEAWQIVNQGKNNPVQAAGADMLKLAMVSLPEWMFIVLVIHDEIICEVPKSQAKKACKILKEVMEQAADYITGIKGLIKVTPRISMDIMKD